MKLPSLSFLLEAFLQTARRFPIALAAALAGTGALLWLIGDDFNVGPQPPELKVFMVALLGLPLFIARQAFAESVSQLESRPPAPAWLPWAVNLGGVALLVAYYLVLDPFHPGFQYKGLPRYFALLIVAHLAVAVAPYLNRRSVEDFWEYNKQLFANFVIGAAYTMILFVGLSAAILAVDQLFNLDINERIYLRLFVVLAGIFNTVFFLYRFPETYHFEATDEAYNAIFKNLCQYILIPIVGLYFLILYAYSAKIIGTWTLPQGWVSSLVIGFSTAGIFTYLLNYLLPRYEGGMPARTFSRWFWWVLLPMTVLLFAAIGRRLADYGITAERYFVAATGIWLLGMCLYFILSRTDNIKFIPLSLALVILWAFFGPYNAFQASERSQFKELKSVLTILGRWENDRIRPGAELATGDDADRARSILRWLSERDRLDLLAPHLPIPLDSLTGGTPTNRDYWTPANNIATWLKLDPNSRPVAEVQRQISLSTNNQLTPALEIRSFSECYPVMLTPGEPYAADDFEGRYLLLSRDGLRLELREIRKADAKSTVIESFNLNPVLRSLRASGALNDWGRELKPTETRYDLHGRRYDLRFLLRQATVQVEKDSASFTFIDGVIFVREK